MAELSNIEEVEPGTNLNKLKEINTNTNDDNNINNNNIDIVDNNIDINNNNNNNIFSQQKVTFISPTGVYRSNKNSLNFLAHLKYVRGDIDGCISVLNKCNCNDDNTNGGNTDENKEKNESKDKYETKYSLIQEGLINRQKGSLNKSLVLFKKAYSQMNENEINYIFREIGKTFYLLGKYQSAIDIYNDLIKRNQNDWIAIYGLGLCNSKLCNHEEAAKLFEQANEINGGKNEDILMSLGDLYYNDMKNKEKAMEKYEEALDVCDNNYQLLTNLGSLYLKSGDSENAEEFLKNAVKIDQKYSNSLLGLASLHQKRDEFEEALIYYKICSITNPNSAMLWNNLGLCFFRKNKKIAAVTCLKKANFLSPFEWIISFNLGIVYLNIQQYTSAFLFMNAAGNLKKDNHIIYMFLGIILSELKDIKNASAYFEKSLSIKTDYLTIYNYMITLIKFNKLAEAKERYNQLIKMSMNSDISNTDKSFIKEDLQKIQNILN